MKDIQNQLDHRHIDIKKVGVKTVTYPITVLDKARNSQTTIATISMYVNLPHRFKGTHMSRFIEILNRFHGKIDIRRFSGILEEMKRRLNAEAAHLEMVFPYFLHRHDESAGLRLCRYECAMNCFLEKHDDLRLDICVPITPSFTTCEHSKAEVVTGVWGKVRVSVRFRKFMWIEDIIDIVELAVREQTLRTPDESVSAKPIETLLADLEHRFAVLDELKWYGLTVEDDSRGYSLCAGIESSNPASVSSD